MTDDALFESNITSLPLLGRGKVRDIYSVDEKHLLIVTTDRLSAYDVVLPDPVPGKGEVLTTMSRYWFARMTDLAPNHLTDVSNRRRTRRCGRRKTPRPPINHRSAPESAANRGRGARIPHRFGMARLPRDRRRLRHPATFRPAASRKTGSANLYARDQSAGWRSRRKHQLRANAGSCSGIR